VLCSPNLQRIFGYRGFGSCVRFPFYIISPKKMQQAYEQKQKLRLFRSSKTDPTIASTLSESRLRYPRRQYYRYDGLFEVTHCHVPVDPKEPHLFLMQMSSLNTRGDNRANGILPFPNMNYTPMKPGVLGTCGGDVRLTLSQFKSVFQQAKQDSDDPHDIVHIAKSLEKLFAWFPSSIFGETSVTTAGRTSRSISHITEKIPRQTEAQFSPRVHEKREEKVTVISASVSDGHQLSCPLEEVETIVHSRKRSSDTALYSPTKKRKSKPLSRIRIEKAVTPEQATDYMMLQSPLLANSKKLDVVVSRKDTKHYWWGRHMIRPKNKPSFKIRIGDSITTRNRRSRISEDSQR